MSRKKLAIFRVAVICKSLAELNAVKVFKELGL